VIQLREATRADVDTAAATLARAFADDPVLLWLLPDAERMPRLFATLLRHVHLRSGGTQLATDDAGRLCGVAVWDPPGYRPTTLQALRSIPALIAAMGRRAAYGQSLEATFERVRPKQPHWYLAHLGTEPDQQGRGVGSRLLRSRLETCDAERVPAYLESSKQANVPYYERFGFVVREQVTLPMDGPDCWTMWREPA
jgi:ribosomal protein S18 acetylase RimI-like enzyme